MSETESLTPKRRGIFAFFRSEILIGSLVALLSILTALIGYRSSQVESMSDDMNLNAQRTSAEANRVYLDVGQLVVQDFISYDSWFAVTNNEAEDNYISSFSDILYENFNDPDRVPFDERYFQDLLVSDTGLLDKNEIYMLDIISFDNYYASTNISAADNFYASFSGPLIDNLEDPEREALFDDAYYNGMYAFSNACFIEANILFEQGQQVGDLADQYQYVMFVFAVALAMSAWASLLGDSGKMRLLFVFFSLAMLLFGALIYFGLFAEAADILQTVTGTTCLDSLIGG